MVRRLVCVMVLACSVLLFSGPVWALSLDDELAGLFSGVDGSVTIGNPVVIDEYTIVPIVRWRMVTAGNELKTRFPWQAGGLEVEPIALVVVSQGVFQVFHIASGEVLPGLALGPGFPLLNDHDFEERLSLGKELLQSGDLDQARTILESLTLQRPDSAEAHAVLGQIYGFLADKTTDLEEKIRFGMDAFREFARALEIDPENPRALMARGYARLLVPPPLGGIDLALEDFTLALEHDPDLVPALNGLGEVYLSLGEEDKALELFERSLVLEPGNQQALRGLNTIKEGGNR